VTTSTAAHARGISPQIRALPPNSPAQLILSTATGIVVPSPEHYYHTKAHHQVGGKSWQHEPKPHLERTVAGALAKFLFLLQNLRLLDCTSTIKVETELAAGAKTPSGQNGCGSSRDFIACPSAHLTSYHNSAEALAKFL
jgi:hypothetical protein